MKRLTYLALCILIGVLASFVVHAVVEQAYITLLLSDFTRWSFGLSWSTLLILHHVLSWTLIVVGAGGGYVVGIRWWRIVYLERKGGLFLTTHSQH